MNEKLKLFQKVEKILEEKNFNYLAVRSCFDIIAKKDKLFLLKVLFNVDGLLESHAKSMRAMAHFLSANPFVISEVNNREKLLDGVVYERYELPVVTSNTFENILDGYVSISFSAKGRHTVEIDVNVLKEKRRKMNYSLKKLADLVGISKKAMYEIESQRVNPKESTAKRLEKILDVNLIKKYEPKIPEKVEIKPRDRFTLTISRKLQSIGIDNSYIYSKTFNLVGRIDKSLISFVGVKPKKESVKQIEEISDIASSYAVVISKKYDMFLDVPSISEEKLKKIKNPKELKEVLGL